MEDRKKKKEVEVGVLPKLVNHRKFAGEVGNKIAEAEKMVNRTYQNQRLRCQPTTECPDS